MSSVSMPIVAILAAVYVAGVAGAAPDLAGYAHRVVCESFRDGNWELYVMNADGSDPVNLTQTDDVHELYPHASPDGLRICFVADRGEGRERTRTACVMNVDGSERIEIGPGRQPCWHPDGGAIAYLPAEFTEFTFMDYATRGIEVYDVVAKTITKHPNDAIHHLYNLCYAAGGDWFVATVHGGMGYDHAILAIEASGTRVVDLGIGGCRPDISPDGTKIAWGPSDWKLQIADISFAGDEPKVTNRRDVMTSAAPNKIYHIDWSPDGRYVAFSRGPTKKGLGPVCELVGVKADGWDICVADAAATNDYSIITTGGDSNKEADWVPAASEGPSVLKTGSGIEMALLPGGWFEMGNDDGESDEAPVHRVWVDSFLIDRYEMTQEAYSKFVLANPSHFKGDSRPVEQMSWAQAALCCNERSRAEGLEPCYDEDTAECNFDANGYRLPTEAEWERACRAGGDSDYAFGDDSGKLVDHAWVAANSAETTHPVGQKLPNSWGLHDMHGNVAEWCNDLYGARYYDDAPEKNPRGPADGGETVLRGGAWNSEPDECRSSHRLGDDPGFQDPCFRGDHIGFRCVRRAP